jgi:hypothetical protein
VRLGGERDIERVVDALIPLVVERALQRIDLTALVAKNVDLDALVAEVDTDAVAARIDVDAVARRLDIDAVIARIDLVGLAEEVINAIDLPEIIRESTGSMASETVRGVRMQSIGADETVARIVDRILLRRRRRATATPTAGEPERTPAPDTGVPGAATATPASPARPDTPQVPR